MGFTSHVTNYPTCGVRVTIPARLAKITELKAGDMFIWTYNKARDVLEIEIRRE